MKEASQSWWARRLWKLPVWGWIVVAVAVVSIGGALGGGDDETADSAHSTVPATNAATVPITEPAAPVESVPAVQAAGCPEIAVEFIDQVNGALVKEPVGNAQRTGLTLAAATSNVEGDVRYIVGSIYDDTGFRVSSADTWVVIDGELLALSGSANEYSAGLRDARDVLTDPSTGFNSPVQNELDTCARNALRA